MIAAGVVMALVLSAALARRGLNAWWVMLGPSLSCWRPLAMAGDAPVAIAQLRLARRI